MPIIALDSNVFIYVLQKNPDFYQPALLILKNIEISRIQGLSSQLTYLEALSFSGLNLEQIGQTKNLLEASGTVFIPISSEILEEAARLRRIIPSLKTPDAIHLATASINGAEQFITNDIPLTRFKEVEGVKIVLLKDFKL